jgi:Omp85 superfamily domain
MMNCSRPLIAIVFVILTCRQSFSQPPPEKFKSHGIKKYRGIFVTPLFSYAPETRLAFGASMVTYFRMNKNDSLGRPSVLHPFIGRTMNHQTFNENQFLLFFNKEKYYSYGDLSFFNFPYRFYGVGNNNPETYRENYHARFFRIRVSFLRKVIKRFYAGVKVNFDHYAISHVVHGGPLDRDSPSGITGSCGGVNSGLGPMFLYDSRDNIFATTKGSFVELASVFNSGLTGSNYRYQFFSLDVRKFKSFKGNNVIALQGYFNFTNGNVPFYQLALMGGPRRMRGYYEGRYRDKNIALIQVEYRSPFLWRIGFATFGALGTVYHNRSEINPDNIKPSFGGGLRLRLDKREKLNLRIDVAKGYKSVGYYFILNEAF